MSRLRKKINTLLLQYQNKWNSMWLLIKWNLHSIVFETIKRNKHWSIAIKMHNNLNSSWKASYLGLFLLQGLIILILLKKRTNNDFKSYSIRDATIVFHLLLHGQSFIKHALFTKPTDHDSICPDIYTIAFNQKMLEKLLCILKSSTLYTARQVLCVYTFGWILRSFIFLNSAIALSRY